MGEVGLRTYEGRNPICYAGASQSGNPTWTPFPTTRRGPSCSAAHTHELSWILPLPTGFTISSPTISNSSPPPSLFRSLAAFDLLAACCGKAFLIAARGNPKLHPLPDGAQHAAFSEKGCDLLGEERAALDPFCHLPSERNPSTVSPVSSLRAISASFSPAFT